MGWGVSSCQQVSEPPSCVWPPVTFLSVAWTLPGKLAAYETSVTEALTGEETVLNWGIFNALFPLVWT